MSRVQRYEDRYLWEALNFEGLLRRVIKRYVDNDSDVEELLSETYERLVEVGSNKEHVVVQSVRTFAVSIAYHLAVDWLRQKKRCPIDPEGLKKILEWADGQAPLDETLDRELTMARLKKALHTFSPQCQQVLWLRWVADLTIPEIAERLGIGENGVKYHLRKAAKAFPGVLFEGRESEIPTAASDVPPQARESP